MPKEQEIELVVFKKECDVVLAGVQCSNWKAGWKNSTAQMGMGGVLFTLPGYRLTLIPMSAIRQIEFTKD